MLLKFLPEKEKENCHFGNRTGKTEAMRRWNEKKGIRLSFGPLPFPESEELVYTDHSMVHRARMTKKEIEEYVNTERR